MFIKYWLTALIRELSFSKYNVIGFPYHAQLDLNIVDCVANQFEKPMCGRVKMFYLSQPGMEPRSLDLQANTLPCRHKSQLLPQGSRSVLYIPRPGDTCNFWRSVPLNYASNCTHLLYCPG